MSFFNNLFGSIGGGVASSLAKVALLGFASKLLTNTTDKSSQGQPEVVDPGVRLQLNPSPQNQIPVLYGNAFFGGNITDAQLSNDYKTMTYCLTLAEITGDKLSTTQATAYTFKNVYLNNKRVVFKADGVTVDYTLDNNSNQDISMRDLIKVYLYGGQVGLEPSGYASTTPLPSTVMPGWTALTHPMEGLIYAIVQVTYNKSKNVSGLPDCIFNIESDMTLPGDILVDYMTNTLYGAGIDSAEIDGSAFAALNTYCTAGFSYRTAAGVSTSGPITIGALIDTKTNVLTNMEELATAGSSWISYDIHSGYWIVVINQAGSPIVTLTDSHLVGEISISGTSLTQLSNIANVKYQNSDILDKTDFVKITIPELDLFQNEPRASLELTLPFNNQQAVALKLGLQILKQARVDKIISFKTDYSYMNLRAGDIIGITSEPYGYTNKAFRIITVEETEGTSGEIILDFKCLEYAASVYQYDIQEYSIETDDGILSIGSIGKPNTPTVTKTEQANVPKIVINAVVPSGIVDAMEFWITFDVTVPTESSRTYVQIGSFSNTSGTTLTENSTVTYTYSGLSQGDFFVKVRGVNTLATGPYSDPTGLIEYVPIVVADTITNEPVSIGGQLMGLGILTLLNNLDKLFAGDSATGGVFDKIFKTFKDVTGVDLVGDAQDGTLVVKQAPVNCYLSFSTKRYPSDRSTGEIPERPYTYVVTDTYLWNPPQQVEKILLSGSLFGDHADISGSYYFSMTQMSGISAGSGNVKLYKSDGTLIQTITAGGLNIDATNGIINIPFSTRTVNTDYYILMDEGVIVGADGCISPKINDPLSWNFHTASPAPRPRLAAPPPPNVVPLPVCVPMNYVRLQTRLFTDIISPDNLKVDVESNIGLVFDKPFNIHTSGTIRLRSSAGIHQTFDLSQTFAATFVTTELVTKSSYNREYILFLNPTTDLAKNTTYWVEMDAGCIKATCNNAPNAAITTATFTTDPGPTNAPKVPSGGAGANAGVTMNFDRPVKPGSGTIDIKDSSGNVIKTVSSTDPAVSIKEG